MTCKYHKEVVLLFSLSGEAVLSSQEKLEGEALAELSPFHYFPISTFFYFILIQSHFQIIILNKFSKTCKH